MCKDMELQYDSNKEVECVFCHKSIKMRESNNPDPAATIQSARCCDWCNQNIVIPARIAVAKIIRDARQVMEQGTV